MKWMNLLMVAVIIIVIAIAIESLTPKKPNAQRLACHKRTVVFEKVYKPVLVKEMQDALHAGDFKIKSEVLKSKYMSSKLFDYVKLEEVDNMVQNNIATYKTSPSGNENKLIIDYFIYENDKNDPGKKTQKSKLYTGYLRFDLLYEMHKVYYVQVDFMDLKGKDIKQSVACAIESIMTIQ